MKKPIQWLRNQVGDLKGYPRCHYCHNTLWRKQRGKDVPIVREGGIKGLISMTVSFNTAACLKCSPQ